MHSTSRRTFLQAAASTAALGTLALPPWARAQTIDTVKIVCGFPAGGTADAVSRRVADKLRGEYARTAIVDNRAGAGGRIAIDVVRTAPPDGATLLIAPHSALTVYPFIYTKLAYDPFVDLMPVSMGPSFSIGLGVGPAVPAEVKTVRDFLAWAKANPGSANYASPAAGSTPHFMGAMLEKASGVELKHVPYRGAAPGIQDLLAGQIAAMCTPVGDYLQHVKAGKLRLLGTSGAARTRFTPEVPTMTEQGFPSIAFEEWYAFFAPKGTPAAVVQRASAAVARALAQPDVAGALSTLGLEAKGSTPEELAREVRAEYDRWGPIVKSIGFTADS